MEWSICQQTGWSLHYLRWKVSWLQIQMMLVDSPRLRRRPKQKLDTADKLMNFIDEATGGRSGLHHE